ncbi:hypothetical protein ES703_67601 [subsurface metagenome]
MSTLQPTGLRHGFRHCPPFDDPIPCLDTGFGGRTFYVDPVNGLDTYDGLMSYHPSGLHGPWRTLTYAFSAAAPLGLAVAGVKGPYHDYLVMLPGVYEPLETWPITVPATKDSVHVIGSGLPGFNSPEIGTLGAYTVAHATEPTLIIEGKDFSMEGVKIFGPTGDFPVVRINETLAALRYNWIRGRDDGGDGVEVPAAGLGWFSRLEHNWIDCYVDTAVAALVAEESVTFLNNRIMTVGGGIDLLGTADWAKLLWNRIFSGMTPWVMDFGIHLQDSCASCEIDENKIAKATAGESGVERRVFDESAKTSNWFGRNHQLGQYQAGPPAGINKAGNLITDGGVGSGYSTD